MRLPIIVTLLLACSAGLVTAPVAAQTSKPAAPQSELDAFTIQALTRKVAIFAGPDFLITIHRTEKTGDAVSIMGIQRVALRRTMG